VPGSHYLHYPGWLGLASGWLPYKKSSIILAKGKN
jgi:hypothetical protein